MSKFGKLLIATAVLLALGLLLLGADGAAGGAKDKKDPKKVEDKKEKKDATEGKKAVNRPKVPVAKHNIEAAHFQVENPPKGIPFKKFELADVPVSDKVTADTAITLPNKKEIKVGDYLNVMNKTEAKLNQHGYSFRRGLPKGGVKISLKAKTPDDTVAMHERVYPFWAVVVRVGDKATSGPVNGAEIVIQQNGQNVLTFKSAPNGKGCVLLPTDSFTVVVTKAGYKSVTKVVNSPAGSEIGHFSFVECFLTK